MKADPIKALIHYERTLRNLEPYIDNEEETDRRFQILTYVMTAVRLAEYYHGEEAKPEEHQLALELLGKANNAAAKIPQVDPTDTTTYLSKTPNIYISKVTNWIEETSKRVKLENGKVSVNGWNKKP
jgi:hypothetical protein